MSRGALKEVLKGVRLVREKLERLEELVEERLIGLEEPLEDEVKAIEEYVKAKEKGSVELISLEGVEKENSCLQRYHVFLEKNYSCVYKTAT